MRSKEEEIEDLKEYLEILENRYSDKQKELKDLQLEMYIITETAENLINKIKKLQGKKQ